MISGGNATIFVSSMDDSVRFYCEVLGMRLAERYGNDWATVDAGGGFTIGLHPASPKYPAPGTKGGMMLGLEVNEPLAVVVPRLQARRVHFHGDIIRDKGGTFANLEDPDGNPIYLWQMAAPAAEKP